MGFQEAVTQVLKDEGGYFENKVTGEVVNFGITLNFVKGCIDRTATNEYIKALTKEQAIAIYEQWFWEPLEKLTNQSLAALIFYLRVNQGKSWTDLLVQMCGKSIGASPIIRDGIIGKNTLSLLNACDQRTLYTAICQGAEGRYKDIAKDPKHINDLPGWLARLGRYKTAFVA